MEIYSDMLYTMVYVMAHVMAMKQIILMIVCILCDFRFIIDMINMMKRMIKHVGYIQIKIGTFTQSVAMVENPS